jgi:MarR family transcriptional regulator for hemolysin
VQVVELTPAGVSLFDQLVTAAIAFDQRLRAGVTDADVAQLRGLLTRLEENVAVE